MTQKARSAQDPMQTRFRSVPDPLTLFGCPLGITTIEQIYFGYGTFKYRAMNARPSPAMGDFSQASRKEVARQVDPSQSEALVGVGHQTAIPDCRRKDWTGEGLKLSCQPTPRLFADFPDARVCGESIGSTQQPSR